METVGMYTGYRILARLKSSAFQNRLEQFLEWDKGGPDELSELIKRLIGGSTYFEFEVDNFGRRLDGDVMRNDGPFKKGNYIDAFFSTKIYAHEPLAFKLCQELELPPNTVVPFMMAQYEENRCYEYGHRTSVYFAKRGDDDELQIMRKVYNLDILEIGFNEKDLVSDLVDLYKQIAWAHGRTSNSIELRYHNYLDAMKRAPIIDINSSEVALKELRRKQYRDKFVYRHKNKRLRGHLKG